MTPLKLAPQYQSLPPILYIIHLISISSCSKAPWGLFVQSRVTCIFTGIKNHYAFRAGQNLPDKEFRYLRTVIVTAAVHWGFSLKLCFIDLRQTNFLP